MPRILMLRGLPASGKTTWAKLLMTQEPGVWKRVSKDDLRTSLDSGAWSPANEEFILKVRDFAVKQAIADGFNVIVDDTNFENKHLKRIQSVVSEIATVEVKEFNTSVEECLHRDALRENPVGPNIILRMHEKYIKNKRPQSIEPPESAEYIQTVLFPTRIFDPKQPSIVICDIDGTLALSAGLRSPYDTTKYEGDLLNLPVWLVVRAVLLSLRLNSLSTYTFPDFVLVSGRAEKYRIETERWLFRNGVVFDALFMRPTGDKRKDTEIKREIFEQHLKDKNILCIFDDRSRIVAMWRSLGLTVFQVANGDF